MLLIVRYTKLLHTFAGLVLLLFAGICNWRRLKLNSVSGLEGLADLAAVLSAPALIQTPVV